MRKGSLASSSFLKPTLSRMRCTSTSLRSLPGLPPIHLSWLVAPSHHEYGDTRTSTPPFLTILAKPLSIFSGSGTRHTRFAASSPSNSPSAGSTAMASPTSKRHFSGCMCLSSVMLRFTPRRPCSGPSYSAWRSCAIRCARRMKAAERSTPTTSSKYFESSKDDMPTAQPRSSTRPSFSGLYCLNFLATRMVKSKASFTFMLASYGWKSSAEGVKWNSMYWSTLLSVS
mmetsp:Transcript_31390/g.96970  ORF Transcript_31390/g.96970 Transcript_31390/m.96970 type:complete len:228 (-) Transcript_31390:154-837(-)